MWAGYKVEPGQEEAGAHERGEQAAESVEPMLPAGLRIPCGMRLKR